MIRLLARLGSMLQSRRESGGEALARANLRVDALAERIGRSELFCNVSPGVIHDLLCEMSARCIAAGRTIVREGDRGDALYVLANGRAAVTRRPPDGRDVRTLAILTEPAIFGEEALLGSGVRPATVTMESDGLVLRISRGAFAEFVGRRAVRWIDTQAAMHMKGGRRMWILLNEARGVGGQEGAVLDVTLDEVRERMTGMDRGLEYFCCSRDDAVSAIAAFALMQRGFEVQAVRNGRAVLNRWRRHTSTNRVELSNNTSLEAV